MEENKFNCKEQCTGKCTDTFRLDNGCRVYDNQKVFYLIYDEAIYSLNTISEKVVLIKQRLKQYGLTEQTFIKKLSNTAQEKKIKKEIFSQWQLTLPF